MVGARQHPSARANRSRAGNRRRRRVQFDLNQNPRAPGSARLYFSRTTQAIHDRASTIAALRPSLSCHRLVPVLVLALLPAVSCRGNPAAPEPTPQNSPTDIVSFEVTCPGVPSGKGLALFVGEEVHECDAKATQRNGVVTFVGQQTAWSVGRPDLVSAGPATLANGAKVIAIKALAPGQTTISASAGGKIASLPVSVVASDVLIFGAAPYQGSFIAGDAVNMWAVGEYSVASAETGQLTLRIADQNGPVATISQTAQKNFNQFVLGPLRFIVPADSTRLCPTVILEIGSVTVSQSHDDIFCVPVVPLSSIVNVAGTWTGSLSYDLTTGSITQPLSMTLMQNFATVSGTWQSSEGTFFTGGTISVFVGTGPSIAASFTVAGTSCEGVLLGTVGQNTMTLKGSPASITCPGAPTNVTLSVTKQ